MPRGSNAMRQITIRKLMLLIAIVAGVLGGFIEMARWTSFRETRCGLSCPNNLRRIVLGLLAQANRQGVFPSGTWPNRPSATTS
jgi:hypothetical protein